MSARGIGGRAVPLALTALAAWLSVGAVSPVDAHGASRAAILPPLWTLGALLVAAGLVAGAPRTRRIDLSPLYLSCVALLPWIPTPWPHAFLLWQGPMLTVLWAAIAVALAWPLWARAGRAIAARSPARQAALAAAIAAVCYMAAAWRMAPILPDGDEPHYLIITQSLLSDGDLQIENNHRRHDAFAYTPQVLKPDYLRRGRNGAIYSIHAPGLSALVAPAFALAGYPGVVVFLACLAAFGTWLVWRAAYDLTNDAAAAWVGWASVSLTVPFFFLAFTVYPDGAGAVAVMAATYALVRPARLDRAGGVVPLGVAVALLPWLHTRLAIVAAMLTILIALRIAGSALRGRLTRLAALLAPIAVSFAAWLWFFQAIYGTANPAAPYGGYTQSSLWNAPRGLTGLLLDQQFGVLPNAPVLVVALAGIVWLTLRHRRLGIEILLIAVPYAVAAASYHMWWGGRSSPARFVAAVLLPFGLAVAAAWTSLRSTGRAVVVVLLGASVALTTIMAGVGHGSLVYNVRDGIALWAEAASPLVSLPRALPSLFRGGPGEAWLVAAGWLGAAVAGRWLVRALASRSGHDTGSHTRAVVPLAGAVVLMLGTSLGWAIAKNHPVDAGTGLWRLVAAASSGAARLAFSELPLRAVDPSQLVQELRIPSVLRGRRPGDDVFLRAEAVPPGEYALQATSGLRVDGSVFVGIGRSPAPFASVTLRDAAPDSLPLALSLPAGADVVDVQADPMARRSAGTFVVRVRRLARRPPPAPLARGAVRYGDVVAWFLDEDSWKEPSGFWVVGGERTRVALSSARPASVRLAMRNGAVPNRVHVTVDTGTAERVDTLLSMAPGEARDVALPVIGPERPLLLTCRSESGFRPGLIDPDSLDYRLLGVRIELAQNLTTPPK